MSFSYNKGF